MADLTAPADAIMRDGGQWQPAPLQDGTWSRRGAAGTQAFARIYDSVNAIRARKSDLIATLNG